MRHILEIILGLPAGFLSREGRLSLQFNPTWPFQQYVGGAGVWNFVLVALALALVVYIYRREAKTPKMRWLLGGLRAAILGLVLVLLNRPVLTLGQARREPSVMAILIDDSLSMKVPDAATEDGKPAGRLDAVIDHFCDSDGELLKRLAEVHDVHIYDFSRGAKEIAGIPGPGQTAAATTQSSDAAVDQAVLALRQLKAQGNGTQVVNSLATVLQDLQGQRLAAVVVLTDGRETPSQSPPEALAVVKSYGVNIVPVAVGSENMPRSVAVQSVDFESAAFVDDYTNLRVTVRASGYEPNHPVTLQLLRQVVRGTEKMNVPLTDEAGNPISRTVAAADDKPFEVDLQFKPTAADMPVANLVVQALQQPGDLDLGNNMRPVRLNVLDDHISVLYVDGYPRWDYRYLKNMLLRDKTVKVSCLLTSADPTFRQEGSDDPDRPQFDNSWRITAFPETMDRLLDYDAVIVGDVDPRQFTDAQLQMIADFVSKKGGGFAIVAGPRWSPQGYRNTPIESLLPVIITHTEADDERGPSITAGFRPVLTRAAQNYPLFHFFADWDQNLEYVTNHLQPIFWYCRGVMIKPGVGITLAEHPTDLGPDGRKAPLMVVGTYGTGRTIFSAIDDSWRWRFYTGESIFNDYWIQQLRYLARGRKIGQRKLTFTADRDEYELGGQVNIELQPLSPDVMQQLSPPVSVEIMDDSTGQAVRRVDLQKLDSGGAVYSGSFTADRTGQFSVKLPHLTDNDPSVSFKVTEPEMELREPQVDTSFLARLGTKAPMSLSEAAKQLPAIRSAAKIIPIDTAEPLWDAPIVLIVFAGLITVEWIVRKMLGLL